MITGKTIILIVATALAIYGTYALLKQQKAKPQH